MFLPSVWYEASIPGTANYIDERHSFTQIGKDWWIYEFFFFPQPFVDLLVNAISEKALRFGDLTESGCIGFFYAKMLSSLASCLEKFP